jgi:hypothetical protein
VSSGFATGFADGHTDVVDDCEQVAYTAGLSAGLAKALADLDDPDLFAAARAGFAAVPVERVHEGATVVEHRLAASEGVAILDVRLPPGLVRLRHAGDRPEVVGVRLAAVRIGLVRALLDRLLTEHEPVELMRYRLALRSVGDVVSALEAVRHQLVGMARYPSRTGVAAAHARLTRLDWQVARLFWPEGYRQDHPVRVLFVAELVASTWVAS